MLFDNVRLESTKLPLNPGQGLQAVRSIMTTFYTNVSHIRIFFVGGGSEHWSEKAVFYPKLEGISTGNQYIRPEDTMALH